MAVLDDCPGLNVEICVNGEPLREYDDDGDPKPKTVTKFVEAISGANFEIRTFFAPPFQTRYGVKCKVELDGKYMRCPVYRKSKLFSEPYFATTGATAYENGKRLVFPFCFSELQAIPDSGRSLDGRTKEALASVGIISLSFHFVKNFERREKGIKNSTLPESNIGPVPEKALMADGLSHHATLGQPVEEKSNSLKTTYLDKEKRPFATFNFKYRSLESLKALHIIPRTPTPVPLEERPEEELTPEELLEVVKRLKAKEVAALKVKQEARDQQGLKRGYADDDEVTFVEAKRPKVDDRKPRPDQEVIVLD